MRKITARLGLLGAALMLGSLAAAPAYAAGDPATVPAPKRLGTLGGDSVAIDVNDRGQVVGESTVDPKDVSTQHVFLWQSGVMKDIGSGFSPVDLNNKGHIAVNRYVNGVPHAGIWRDGKVTDLGIPSRSSVNAINDNDEIVGTFRDANDNLHAFVWRRGVVTELPGRFAVASGINNKGVIVGSVSVGGLETRGVVWRGGQPVELGRTFLQAIAINDDGVIVGNGRGASGRVHGFVWKNGAITELPPLGTGGPSYDHTDVKAINNRGEIIGQAATATSLESAIWRNGTVEGFGPASAARGINNHGQVVGNIVESPNPPGFIYHAVIWG
jgi:probable HAF family extracellular repeat protein